jgi:hypothetical protein
MLIIKELLTRKRENSNYYGFYMGGRSSVSGLTVTVFGTTGMVGRLLVNRLGS